MKKHILLLLLAFMGIITRAQVPDGYYDNATGKTGEELRSALHDIIQGHTSISYNQIWTSFWSTDNKGNNVVWDMYSDVPGGTPSYTYNYYNNNHQCGEYDSEGDCYNREHSWPQSWFSNASTPTTDMHHIFPTDGFVNAQHSNYPFGEVKNPEWTSTNGSKLGPCKSSLGYTGKVFEPIDEYKGDFARAIMYMSVRYYGEDDSWGSSGMTDKADIEPWAIDMLLNWSDNDPVSQKEINRNNVIYNDIQHNRNPFVDHPEYAHMIWDEGWSGETYNITCATVQHGSVITNTSSATAGTTIILSNTPENGYTLYSYYVYKTGDPSTIVYSGTNYSFIMPAFDVTVSATFVESSGYSYIKVTNAPTDWSGDYILVYENSATSGFVWTGVDATNCYMEKTIIDNSIADEDMVSLTIAPMSGGYSIQVNGGTNNGKYIYGTSGQNKISFETSPSLNTLEYESNGVKITSNTSVMRYNTDGARFRYYKSSTYSSQQPVQLYQKTGSVPPTTYTITCSPTVDHGSISVSATEAIEGTIIILTATPDTDYELDSWIVTDDNNEPVAVVDNYFEMPASNVTVSANFVFVGQSFEQKYYQVTSTDQLQPGRTYLIVNKNNDKALGTTQNSNNRSGVPVEITDDVIDNISGTVCELTLGGSTGAWTLYDAANNGYLYAAGGGNYLRTQTELNDRGKWNITFTNNAASIVSIGPSSQNTIRYNPNNGNPIFSCYASGQQDVYLFIRSEEYEHTESATLSCLNTFDRHIIHTGAVLTADKVMGTNYCNNTAQIVIEDGAQLIHHSDGLMATFKKSITGYTGEGGWYTIAMPFTDYELVGELNSGNYDLYAYNESGNLEWMNHKSHTDDFTMSPSSGYLYSHQPSTTLRMTGSLLNGDFTETISLSYANSQIDIKGYNLLANPTAHSITFIKSDDVSDGYYYLNNSDEWVYEASNTVPAGRGFMVKANDTGQTVTLNPSSKHVEGEAHNNESLIIINVGDEYAYVKMHDGVSMPLFTFRGKSPRLSLVQDGKPYTMLVNETDESIELNYKPTAGLHNLSVKVEGGSPAYLHLIDRLTGADIDLLSTPNYSFKSASDDDATRFQLIFVGDNDLKVKP